MPCSSAAAITSASRTDPPGWTTAVAPAAATASSPSRNGKKASDAATVPASGRAPASICQPLAFMVATRTASTRLICPAPTARVRSRSVNSTVFDFTWAQTRQAKRNASHSATVGGRWLTTRTASLGQGRRASSTASRCCTSRPPSTERTSRPSTGDTDPANIEVAVTTTRRLGLVASTARASASTAGATTASMKVETSAAAVAASTARFKPTMPPKADNASASRARSNASTALAPVATPHGLVCLITTAAGSSNSSAIRAAASRSSRFVYDSSLPWMTSGRPRPWPAPTAYQLAA